MFAERRLLRLLVLKGSDMPRGVPKSGFRMTDKKKAALATVSAPAEVSQETDEEIAEKLTDRFDVLGQLADLAITGECKSLIVSGPPGLGKSFIVERNLRAWDPEETRHTIVKGHVSKTGLLRLLYQYREGGVIVFDDADSVFWDETSLSLMKSACDSTEIRRISYLAEVAMVDDSSGDLIPRQFEFNGVIVFITNMDFDAMADSGHKLAPHLSAMMSRSHYIDLEMKTRRDYLIRIRQVISYGMLRDRGLDKTQEQDVLDFIEERVDSLRELSLRMAIKLSDLRKKGDNWTKLAKVTCCKAS